MMPFSAPMTGLPLYLTQPPDVPAGAASSPLETEGRAIST